MSPLKVVTIALACWFLLFGAGFGAADLEFKKWRPYTPQERICPDFSVMENGGPDGKGGLVIIHDNREFLDGAWMRRFEIEGGSYYEIVAYRMTKNVRHPRQNTYVELLFHDAKGNLVLNKQTGVHSRPFYASEVGEHNGWTKFQGIFRAPVAATHATVKLELRWDPGGQVEWGGISLVKSPPRKPRKVRLAAVNYRPQGGKTALDNCRQFAPRIARAAEQDADLVVLGECITTVGNGLTKEDAAEPIPGPCTDYLAGLADKYDVYIVTSLNERADHLIYNTAVLLGPDGNLIGTYRKVCLARDEYRGGTAPGREFPVYDTPIGKIGMMICFDVTMPEVARGLCANGAEIVAMPIMGGHPALARARVLENQFYLVTSTYSINDDWMQSGVWDLGGDLLVRATIKDEVVVAEVDLSKQYFWRANMGEIKGRLRHERPAVPLPE